jgi:hypothetical protein
MPIALTYDTRDAVPEVLKDHVAEKDGKFIFEAEPASVVTQTNGKLEKLRGDLDKKTARLGRYAKLEELGDDLDVDDLLSLRELKKQGKPLTADEKAEMERLHKKALDKANGDLAATSEKLKGYESELKRFKLVDPIRAVATSEKVGMFAEDFDLAWSEIGRRFQLVEEEGKKPRIVVLDDDGDPTDTKVEDFFNKLYKQQRPKFFKASGAGGSGAANNTSGGGGNGKTITRAEFDALDQAGRMKVSKDGLQVVD